MAVAVAAAVAGDDQDPVAAAGAAGGARDVARLPVGSAGGLLCWAARAEQNGGSSWRCKNFFSGPPFCVHNKFAVNSGQRGTPGGRVVGRERTANAKKSQSICGGREKNNNTKQTGIFTVSRPGKGRFMFALLVQTRRMHPRCRGVVKEETQTQSNAYFINIFLPQIMHSLKTHTRKMATHRVRVLVQTGFFRAVVKRSSPPPLPLPRAFLSFCQLPAKPTLN